MKRTLAILLFASAICIESFAQSPASSVTITRGTVFDDSKFSSVGPIMGYDDQYYYTDGSIKLRPALFKYDKNMNQVASYKLGNETNGRDVRKRKYVSGNILLLTSVYDKKIKQNTYYVETVNKNTLVPNNDTVNLGVFDDSYMLIEKLYVASEDHSKWLLLHELGDPDKEEKPRFQITIIDGDLKILKNETITLPYAKKLYHKLNTVFENNGNIYFSGILDKMENGKVNAGAFELHINVFPLNAAMQDYTLQRNNRLIDDFIARENGSGNIVIAGLLAEQEPGKVTASFVDILDRASGKVLNTMTKNFKNSYYRMNVSDIVFDGNNNGYLFGERGDDESFTKQYYQNTISGSVSHGMVGATPGYALHTKSYSVSLRETICITKFSLDGAIAWNAEVFKSQYIIGGEYSDYISYGKILSKDKLHIIFNSDVRKNEPYMGKGKSKLEHVAVNLTDGSETREDLFFSKEEEYVYRPLDSFKVSENEIITFGNNGGDIRGIKFKF